MRYFAHALPGLGPLLAEEVAEHAEPLAAGSDGRNDVVTFEAQGAPPSLRTAEDVFAEVGSAGGGRRASGVAGELLGAEGLERALSVYAATLGPLRRRMTFRMVTRVRSEQHFLRSALRDAARDRLGQLRPRWVETDPADLELWVTQVDRSWLAGIRLTTGTRTTRRSERPGALRPSVAAAMVRLAGPPRGRLLDAFCGSGTILLEARGWATVGSDLDVEAVRTAAANGARPLAQADASDLPFATASFEASVSNLPFGERFALPADPRRILRELARVTAPGGRFVLLAPPALEGAIRADPDLEVVFLATIRLLGRPTALWALARR